MTCQTKYGFALLLCVGPLASIGCSSAATPTVPFNSSSGSSSGDSSGGSGLSSGASTGAGGASSGDPSSGSTSGGSSGAVGSSGASSGAATSGSTGGPSSGTAGSGSAGAPDSGTGGPTDSGTKGEGGAPAGGTSLTGTLGTLGTVKPTVSSIVISNSGETLIYLTSAPITCATVMMSRWLGTIPAGTQVVEIVVPSTRMTGTVPVAAFGAAEVNYAPGGMSSAYETVAASGSVTFTNCVASGPCEGTVMATYSSPAGSSIMGSFHAEFCAGGQGY